MNLWRRYITWNDTLIGEWPGCLWSMSYVLATIPLGIAMLVTALLPMSISSFDLTLIVGLFFAFLQIGIYAWRVSYPADRYRTSIRKRRGKAND